MTGDLSLTTYLGNRRIVDILRRAVENGRLPHALIFAGPSGVGKRTLAHLLARYVNCGSRTALDACGKCASCRKIAAGVHPDIREVVPEKSVISVDQIRGVTAEVAFQPFEAAYRVIILDPADQMRTEGANALLKTLEEPLSRTVLILVTVNPYLLLTTIRSRSRVLQFGGIPPAQIANKVREVCKCTEEEAELAAAVSGGSLQTALGFDGGRFKEARALALRYVGIVLRGGRFAELSGIATTLHKDGELFPVWMEAIRILLMDIYFAKVAPDRVVQRDLGPDLASLAGAVGRERIVALIRSMAWLKEALLRNIGRQLALESIFLRMSEVARL